MGKGQRCCYCNYNDYYFVLLLSCFFLIIIVPTTLASGECDCSSDLKSRGSATLKLKMVAMVSILSAGGLGVVIPVLGRWVEALRLRPEKDVFFVIKAFAAGVILSTGLIHILPSAFRSLTSPCLTDGPWGHFPFAGFVSMVSALATMMVDTLATSYYKRAHLSKARPTDEEEELEQQQQQQGGGGVVVAGDQSPMKKMATSENAAHVVHVDTHAAHGNSHDSSTRLADDELESLSQRIRHRVVSQVLELGIVVHSVIIGISLGASDSRHTIRPLVGALSFHQFFEGMGLGGCIIQARFRAKAVVIMALFFSLTTPSGILIGVGISSIYNEDSPRALVTEGILNAASAGILVYMALVDLLAADFRSTKMQTNGKLQLWSYSALFLGAGLMSLLAEWA